MAEVNSGKIELILSPANDVAEGLMGRSYDNIGVAYIKNTQGYKETARTLIHEGGHSLGIRGSRKAEVIVRLMEKMHDGIPINRSTIREILEEIKATGAYDHFPWKKGAVSIVFKGVPF